MQKVRRSLVKVTNQQIQNTERTRGRPAAFQQQKDDFYAFYFFQQILALLHTNYSWSLSQQKDSTQLCIKIKFIKIKSIKLKLKQYFVLMY